MILFSVMTVLYCFLMSISVSCSLQEVPCSTDDILDTTANKEKQRKQQENAEDELKIAWRYKNQPVIQVLKQHPL